MNYSTVNGNVPSVPGYVFHTLLNSASLSDLYFRGDFAALTFNSMGTPFDYVVVDSSTDLTSYLPTSGTAPYLHDNIRSDANVDSE